MEQGFGGKAEKKSRKGPRKPFNIYEEGEFIASPIIRRANGHSPKDLSTPKDMRSSRALSEEIAPKQISEDEIFCLVARSALVIPFNVKRCANPEVPISVLLSNKLLNRTATLWCPNTKTEFCAPVWRLFNQDDVPFEAGDLNILFRQHLVWNSKENYLDEKTWTCRRFVMTEEVRTNLFGRAKIHTVQHNEESSYHCAFTNVELLMFPMGCLIAVIHIDWMRNGDLLTEPRRSISDVRTLLFVSKYRDKVPAVCNGWSFYDKSDDIIPESVRKTLGEDLFNARFAGSPISLKSIQKWIIRFTGNDTYNDDPMITVPVCKFIAKNQEAGMAISEYTRHAFHHSTVVLEQEITGEVLNEYLYHMKRAFGQKNRPPSETKTSTIGKILVWRKNRYIGISREGTVSISWPSSQTDKDFEVHNWHKKFQGIYFLLSLYVWGERMVFSELSDVAASQAEKLRLVDDENMNLEEIRHSRNIMRHLATRMVRYTLSMCSDVGGISEYSEFFTVMRQTFGIPDLRSELSNELKDVLAVVESNYLEEERRQREEEEKESAARREKRKQEQRSQNEKDQRFAIVSSFLGALTIPFVLITGLFGMNLSTLPDPDFITLVVGNLLCSLLIFISLLGTRISCFPNFSRALSRNSVERNASVSGNDSPSNSEV